MSTEIEEEKSVVVEPGTDLEVAPPEDDPRSAIYKRHSEQRREELGIKADSEETPTVETPPEDEEVAVVVNGVERKVLKSKIDAAGGVENYQKNEAGNEKLRLAAEERKALDREKQDLERRRQELARQEEEIRNRAATPATAALSKDEQLALAKQYHEVLFEDPEKAAEILVKLQAAPSATPVSVEEIVQKAAEKVGEKAQAEAIRKDAEKFETARQEANRVFNEQYEDVANDPVLRGIANNKSAEIFAEHPDWTPLQVIEESAKFTRDWVKKQGAQPSSRLDAKRELDQVRGGSARQMPRAEPPPKTKSQAVEDMRKARGLG